MRVVHGASGSRRRPVVLTRALAMWLLAIGVTTTPFPSAFGQAWEGVVREFASGRPIPNAIVRIQATDAQTYADAEGRFRFEHASPEGARVVAGARGYFYEGVDLPTAGPVELFLESVPYDPDAPIASVSSSECVGCHAAQHKQWAASRMGRTAQNRWVYDLYNGSGTPGGMGGFVYTRDGKHAETNPAADCAACHTPMRWAETPGIALPTWEESQAQRLEGVSCLACHNVAQVDMSKTHLPGFHPDSVRVQRGALVRYGSLGDVDYHVPGRMRASYQPQLSADLCSACHQDKSDPHNDGRYDGISSEPTYAEWKNSPYGDPESATYQSCVGCHTSAVDTPRGSTIGPVYTRPLGDLRSHDFHGTTQEYLQRALTLDIETQRDGDDVIARVRVRNTGAGHHVPTGIALRHVIVRVDATIGGAPVDPLEGPRVAALGGVGSPDDGYLAGIPGRLYGRADSDDQGHVPAFFTEAVGTAFDVRIPALREDILEFRYAYEDGAGPLQLQARAIYRRAWRDLIDAKGWTEDAYGGELADILAPNFGIVMATAQETYTPRKERRSGCQVAQGPEGPLGCFAVALGLLAARGSYRRRTCVPSRYRGTRHVRRRQHATHCRACLAQKHCGSTCADIPCSGTRFFRSESTDERGNSMASDL